MRSTTHISLVLLGSLMLSPLFALAEETSASASAGTETTASGGGTGGSATTETSASGSTGTPAPSPSTIRESPTLQSTGKLRESPTKASLTHEVVSPRDAASGLPTGKRLNGLPPGTPVTGTRMNASGTKTLPAGMEERMQNRDDMRVKLEERASTTRDNMQQRREDMKEKRQERRGEILKRQATMLINRMKAAIERIVKLSGRVDSRIVKLKEHGADTSKPEASMVIARGKIADAKAAVAAAEAAVANAVINADASASTTASVDPGKPVREALNKAKDAVIAAHKALVDAIESLKGIKVDIKASTSIKIDSAVTTTP